MNTFTQAAFAEQNKTVTTNGMPAFKSTNNTCVDLFGNIGSARNTDLTELWNRAVQEDADTAFRILLWSRDARGGAGERETFRKLLKDSSSVLHLSDAFFAKVVEIGRWDDLFVIQGPSRSAMLNFVFSAVQEGSKAKEILANLDNLTEEECQIILASMA